MDKKDRFIKLVELESLMKAKEDIYNRAYLTKNVHAAMEVSEKDIPDDILKAAKEFVKYQIGGNNKPEWLS